ncbi:DNA topology modulation protein FlaR [Virgibacillus soli]|uniref:DNA topology modulation protein FlaR n=1 Tax=Paracerasibacillus soli TaxID=480284 RepID=A0ABU5CNS8_9BACI|nr:DNA topology modulation protein FlaR [Virgibacillus soli]MDY0407546.1 DNA topology modulation protein FlaR [Virgibacillus soli]
MKIHIIGSVGSGKTTLAKSISEKIGVPYYELDKVVWRRTTTGDIRKSPVEIEKDLLQILQKDSWIVEGVHQRDWVIHSFNEADIIIVLDLNYSVRVYRIIKRYIRQKLNIETANYRPTFKMFIKMFKWNHLYNRDRKKMFNMFKDNEEKLILIKKSQDLQIFIKEQL